MNDPADSDDSEEFLDALEHLPNERDSMSRENILQKRVESLERQMACISGQMSTILKRLDTITNSQSQLVESRRPMRACHARKRQSQKDAPMTGPTPIPDSKVEPEGVDLDQTTTSIASGPVESHNDTELSGVMKDFPDIPTSAPTSGETRRSKPHVPPITIPVYNGVGHVDDWIELVLADAVAGHWTEATCRNVWMRYLGASVKDYLRTFPAEKKKTFKDVCGLLMKRYGAYRGKDALRRKFEGLKQDKGEKPEDYLDRLVNERMRGWPEESVPDRDSESISKFIYSIHEKNLAWFLNDRLELNKEGGKVLTLEDFRELLMNHLTGVETFEHERANSQLPDH